LERWDGVMWTGLVWLRIGTCGELLWIRYWTFGFLEMLGNYRMAWHLVASRVVLSSIELVIGNDEMGGESGPQYKGLYAFNRKGPGSGEYLDFTWP
jgi:hypothetical protein